MAIKVKDQATAEFAARNLQKGVEAPGIPGEPAAPVEKTTTSKLFPEFVTDDGGIINRPVRAYEDKSKSLPVAATPAPEIPPQISPAPASIPTAKLKPEELAGKTMTVKVDGIEMDVPADQVVKSYQLERHLNAQLMKLAEERATFERLRTVPAPAAPAVPAPAAPNAPAPRAPAGKSAEVQAMEAQIAQLAAQLDQLGQSVAPALRETGLKRLDSEVKSKLGRDDFMKYAPKIQEFVDVELAKPEVAANPEARRILLSSGFWYDQYKEMALRDLSVAPAPAPAPRASNAPALAPAGNAPVVMTNSGMPVSIPSFEPSGGVPARGAADSSWQQKAQDAFNRARQTGTNEAWVDYYRIKAESPQ